MSPRLSFVVAIACCITPAFSAGHFEAVGFGDALNHLSRTERANFERGFLAFSKTFAGVTRGRTLNAMSCSSCHSEPVPGGSGGTARALVPFTFTLTGAQAVQRYRHDPDGELRPNPTAATARVVRRTPALFGLGLLEQIPETFLVAVSQRRLSSGVRGQLARSKTGSGRFGWKATIGRLDEFVAVAFARELGVHEHIDSKVVKDTVAYIRGLAAPPRTLKEDRSGREIFRRVGCAECHLERAPVNVRSQSGIVVGEIAPFTDLLLHHMGPGMAEFHESGDSGDLFRTAPLWGVSSTGPPYLHDARASTLDEAIQAHGGEAQRAADSYRTLSPAQRVTLLYFLKTL